MINSLVEELRFRLRLAGYTPLFRFLLAWWSSHNSESLTIKCRRHYDILKFHEQVITQQMWGLPTVYIRKKNLWVTMVARFRVALIFTVASKLLYIPSDKLYWSKVRFYYPSDECQFYKFNIFSHSRTIKQLPTCDKSYKTPKSDKKNLLFLISPSLPQTYIA